jgi:RNA polymerase sigma-70 factor (ECF subfamily)
VSRHDTRRAKVWKKLAIPKFGHYAPELRTYLLRRLGRPQDVDDLAQEVNLRLLSISPEKDIRKPMAFIYSVAARVLADYREKRARNDGVFVPSDDASADALDQASEALSDKPEENLAVRQSIEEALSKLPAMQAAVLVLHKRDGMSYEEVAVKLGISVHTVHKYLTKAMAHLRMRILDR